jgi:hypothetical protein
MSADHPTTPVEYRTIDRLPGYRFGDDGSCWSRWGQASNGYARGTRSALMENWRALSGTLTPDGYIHLSLKVRGGKHRGFQLHRLVLEAFVGPCPSGMEALHGDGNGANNRLGNLRWGTHPENMADAKRHGTTLVGARHPNAKLTDESVISILVAVASGESSRSIAARFGVSKDNVLLIAKGKTWTHLPRPLSLRLDEPGA